MRIGIEMSAVTQKSAGIGQYTKELVKSYAEKYSDTLVLFTYDKTLLEDFKDYPNVEIKEVKIDNPGIVWIFKTALAARRERLTLFISNANFIFSVLVPNTVQIFHDILPITHPQFWPEGVNSKFKRLLGISTHFAKLFVTTADYNKSELTRMYPRVKDKVESIGGGVHRWVAGWETEEDSEQFEALELPENFFLTVGTIQPRKNHMSMLKAFEEFSKHNPGMKLVIVGKKGWMYEEVMQKIEQLSAKNIVTYYGYLSDSELSYVYSKASGFVYMTFAEGFALPVMEAYSKRLPILASNIPVMREVMGDRILYADPNDIIEIAERLMRLKEHQPIGKQVTEFLELYSWEHTVDRLNQILYKYFS